MFPKKEEEQKMLAKFHAEDTAAMAALTAKAGPAPAAANAAK